MGTGTGVLPRNLYRYGATWTANDISENQIEQAKRLSKGMNIDYYAVSAKTSDTKAFSKYFEYMLEHGVHLAPSQFEAIFLSDAHTEEDIRQFLELINQYF